MPYRALTEVLLGNGPAAKPGDILPDTFPSVDGNPIPVDFDRLLELGAVEKVPAKGKAKEVDPGTLTRPELDKLAAKAGVEDPEKLPNKPAVLDALEEKS